MAARTRPKSQPSGVHHLAVGEAMVSAVNDGIFPVAFEDLVGAPRADCEATHRAGHRIVPPWLTINTFLVDIGGSLALVDTGFAGKTGTVGRLLDNLASIDVGPGDIDLILMTHMHPDHEAGLTDATGRAVFPRAELVLHEDEHGFWTDDGALARSPEAGKGDFALARAALAAYRGRITQVRDGTVIPGIRAFPTPGHTPGHTAWLVESAGDALLLWGDIVHFPGIQFALPQASVAFDLDAVAAAAARRRLFDIVATEKLRVGGIHLDFPSFGHVAAAGDGFAFIPEAWRPMVAPGA